jgi:hypothetical protein
MWRNMSRLNALVEVAAVEICSARDRLRAVVQPRYDADSKNDFLRWSARVHATDNYEVVVAFGEFAPGFEANRS